MLHIKIHQFNVKKELLSLLRLYRKNATKAQADGQIATDGPSYTGWIFQILTRYRARRKVIGLSFFFFLSRSTTHEHLSIWVSTRNSSRLHVSFIETFTNSCPYFFRSSRPEVFCKKGVLWIFEKFTRKHLAQSLFFNKIAGLWYPLITPLITPFP